jgi:hypothetical protein
MPNFFLSHKRVKVADRLQVLSGSAGRARPGFAANAPRSGPRTAGFTDKVAVDTKERKRSGSKAFLQERRAMRLLTGWIVSAGLVVTAGAANAEILAPYDLGSSPYAVVSDVGGHYAAMPPEAPASGYGPSLLPPREVYTVVRDSGFSPLGVPQQRGLVYTIAVIDRGGDDGRLVIDARTGRIIRFLPANRMGDNFNDDLTVTYGPVGPPPISNVPISHRGVPRPPASIPHVASRTPSSVPLPKAPPARAEEPKPLAASPAPAPEQQSAAVRAKPADVQPISPAAAPATPVPAQILPTQEMPTVQGLE